MASSEKEIRIYGLVPHARPADAEDGLGENDEFEVTGSLPEVSC